MPRIADEGRLVTGGVDTRAEVHVAAVADQAARVLGTRVVPGDRGRATVRRWPG